MKVDFSIEFSETSKDLTEVMQKMLEFNPFKRFSANSLLKSPVFDSIRKPELEKPSPIKFDLDIDNDFDYENIVPKTSSVSEVLIRL